MRPYFLFITLDFAKRLEFGIRKKKPNAFDSVFNYEAEYKANNSLNQEKLSGIL